MTIREYVEDAAHGHRRWSKTASGVAPDRSAGGTRPAKPYRLKILDEIHLFPDADHSMQGTGN